MFERFSVDFLVCFRFIFCSGHWTKTPHPEHFGIVFGPTFGAWTVLRPRCAAAVFREACSISFFIVLDPSKNLFKDVFLKNRKSVPKKRIGTRRAAGEDPDVKK